jgi:hypothetical protein
MKYAKLCKTYLGYMFPPCDVQLPLAFRLKAINISHYVLSVLQ